MEGLIESDTSKNDIGTIAILTALSKHCQNTAYVLNFPASIMADTAGPFIFAGTEAKQPGAWMLSVQSHCLAFTDDFHIQPRSANDTMPSEPMIR